MPVTRLSLSSQPLQDGRPFGEVGAYEELVGEVEFAVNPEHPLNGVVVDLPLAPRDADGNVRFTADVRILRPVAAGRTCRNSALSRWRRASLRSWWLT